LREVLGCRVNLLLLLLPLLLLLLLLLRCCVRLLLETLSISLLGTNRQPLDALLAEAAAAYNQSQATRTAVHSVDQVGWGRAIAALCAASYWSFTYLQNAV
jgi:hypothetical protein